MRRIKCVIIITVASILLHGCGVVTSDRIYSICKVDGDTVYCYKNDNEFYIWTPHNFVPTSGVGLRALPALHVIPRDIDYKLISELPGLYNGTLYDVDGYVYTLQQKYSGELQIMYTDWNNIDMNVLCDEFNIRIIYNITGQVRIYATSNGQYLEDIPMLTKN